MSHGYDPNFTGLPCDKCGESLNTHHPHLRSPSAEYKGGVCDNCKTPTFEKAWRVVKEDEAEKWMREYEEAHARGDQETMDRMNAENASLAEAIEEDLLMDDPDYRDKLNREMGDNDPQNACPSCGFYRYPQNEYCRECFDGATPKDRNNPNPHPLDGMLDESFASANEAYSLWDEGYEPDYNSVVEAARNVLEAMGYQVIAPPSFSERDDGGYDFTGNNRL